MAPKCPEMKIKDLQKSMDDFCKTTEKKLKSLKLDGKTAKKVKIDLDAFTKEVIKQALKNAEGDKIKLDKLPPKVKKKEFCIKPKEPGKFEDFSKQGDGAKFKFNCKGVSGEGKLKVDKKKQEGYLMFDLFKF